MGKAKALKQSETEAKARVFVAENEPLLERATPATLHRMILHGSEIATNLSGEVVEVISSHEAATRELTEALNDPKTPPARIQGLEEELVRLGSDKGANGQGKQEVFDNLVVLLDRAITLRQEREVLPTLEDRVIPTPHKTDEVVQETEQPKRGFWSWLFGDNKE